MPNTEAAAKETTVEVIVTKAYEGHHVGDRISVNESDLARLYRKGRVRNLVDARLAKRRGMHGPMPPPLSVPQRMQFVQPNDPGPTVTPKQAPAVQGDPVPDAKEDPGPTVATPEVAVVSAGGGWWNVYINGVPVTKADGNTKNFRKADAEQYRDDYLVEVGAD